MKPVRKDLCPQYGGSFLEEHRSRNSGNERSRQDLWVARQRATQTGKARAQATGSISRPEVILML